MRRILIFLTLFGGGLAVLLLAAHLRDRGNPPEPTLEPPTAEPPITFPETHGGPEGQIGVVLEGSLEFTRFADDVEGARERPRLFHVESVEVRPVESDLYDLHDLTVRMYDTETGELRAVLTSPLTRTRVANVGAPNFADEDRVVFQDVLLELVSGSDFVPATMRVPTLEADLAKREFRSQDDVVLEGRGLDATGAGLFGSEVPYVLRFERRGEVALVLPHGGHGRLAAIGGGPLEIRQLGKLPAEGELPERDLVRLRVERGALLDMVDEELMRIQADTLDLRGFVVDEETFQVLEAYAEGGVELQSGENLFRGERADFVFAPDGRLSTATLDGHPRGTIFVPDPEAAADPAREPQAADALRLEIRSEGRLEVDLLANEAFTATGPTRIEAPEQGFALDSATRMTGSIQRELGTGTFVATGDVRGEFRERRFKGDDLRVDLERASPDVHSVRATTRSPARITGVDERGRPVTIDVQSGVEMRSRGDDFFLPLARQTRVVVEGDEGFELEAGEIRGLDWTSRRFAASGGIVYRAGPLVAVAREARTLHGNGAEAEEVEPEALELELLAGPADPVRVDLLPPGLGDVRRASLRGQRVLLSARRAVAEGRVHAEVEGEIDSFSLDAERIELERELDPADPESIYTPWSLVATDVTRGRIESTFGLANFSSKTVRAAGQAVRRKSEDRPETILDYVEAVGAIELDWRGEVQASARGERLVYDGHTRRGRMEAAADRLVEAYGQLTVGGPSYRVTARAVELEKRAVQAFGVRGNLIDTGRPRNQHRAQDEPVLEAFSADWWHAQEEAVAFSGNVELDGRLAEGVRWSLSASDVWAQIGELESVPGLADTESPIRHLVAWGGFDLRYGRDVRGTGDLLEVHPERLRMEGSPARFDVGTMAWESPVIEYDPVRVLVTTDRGRLTSGATGRYAGWTIEYESLKPFEEADSTIVALRNPKLTFENRELRAGWALLWIDRDEWQKTAAGWLFDEPQPGDLRTGEVRDPSVAPVSPGETRNLFQDLDLSRIAPVLNEVYFEGNIELLEDGERRARLGAAYFDLVDGHGWLQDAELFIDIDVSDQPGRLVVASEWLRHSADGTLYADNATVTTCTHEVPHFVVRTKDLRMTPSGRERVEWDVHLRRNSLRFRNGWSLPLPSIPYPADGRGRPVLPQIRIGDSARFGQFLQATFTRDLGAVGNAMGKALGAEDEDKVEARARYSASYLGSRGVTAGVGAEIAAPEEFWFRAYFDVAYDTGSDRGLVRAPDDEREDFRSLLRTRGRMYVDENEWLDLAIATQSDVGVQAEFFEGEFLEYEERETYLHWRKADGANYYSATAKTRVNAFRNEIEELPTLGAFRGLTPLFETFGRPVYFRGSVDAGFFRRRHTDSVTVSPFDPVFDDGVTDDRGVQRIDGQGRLELPFALGDTVVSLTPFTAVRSTAWSEGIDEDESLSRHALLAGVVASTTLWRRTSGGWMHDVTPRLGVRTDIASDEPGDRLLFIDSTELPIDGTFVDADLRLRWWRPDTLRHLDFDLRLTHASDRADGGENGFLPIAVLGQFLTEVGGDPVGLVHDGRYDPEDGGTVFNRTALGWEPNSNLGLETGYARGVYEPEGTLYEAVTLGVRFRGTGAWELEGRQTLNLRDDNSNLDSRILLRRYGHDLIFEFELGRRSGEGGTSFSIGLDPVLGWRRPRLGLLDRWLRP